MHNFSAQALHEYFTNNEVDLAGLKYAVIFSKNFTFKSSNLGIWPWQ